MIDRRTREQKLSAIALAMRAYRIQCPDAWCMRADMVARVATLSLRSVIAFVKANRERFEDEIGAVRLSYHGGYFSFSTVEREARRQ